MSSDLLMTDIDKIVGGFSPSAVRWDVQQQLLE